MIAAAPLLRAFKAAALKPTIVCDVDGVLACLESAAIGGVNARFGTAYTLDSAKQYSFEGWLPPEQWAWLAVQFDTPAFYSTMAPDYRGIDALAKLYAAGYYVIIASDRPDAVTPATKQWLADAGVGYDEIHDGKDIKAQIAGQYGPDAPMILIDDDPKKMLLARQGVEVWAPRFRWTPMDLGLPFTFVFVDWSEVTERLLDGTGNRVY